MQNDFDYQIKELKQKGLYRKLKILTTASNPHIKINQKEYILLCSNNYLGLTTHPEVIKSAIYAIKKYGTGSGASRLISGTFSLHKKLEKEIADFKDKEAALVFSTGYMANIGLITALQDKVIIIDKYNHASIIDGVRLSRAKIRVYPHKDIDYLEKILKSEHSRKLIITDGIFSMDGDIAPLPEIVTVAKKYNAKLMVDDAHATGVLGKDGKGTPHYFNLENEIDIVMGTFSKALGSLGGFITGYKNLIDYLINKSRAFIYSTALPPVCIAVSLSALKIVQSQPKLREKLWNNAIYLKNGLKKLGFKLMSEETHIIPIFIGDEKNAIKITDFLFKNKIFVPAIRPPTIPNGTSRLRITVMATHTKDDLDYVLDVFRKI